MSFGEVVPIIESGFFLCFGEIDVGEAGAFLAGLCFAGSEGVERELQVDPAEGFSVVFKLCFGGEVCGLAGGVGGSEVGGGRGLGRISGFIIEKGGSVFALVDAVNVTDDGGVVEGHFKTFFGGFDMGGAMEFDVLELAIDEGLDAAVEGFLLEAKCEGERVAEFLLEVTGGGFLEFAGEGFGVE